MRSTKTISSALAAMLCATALFASACGRQAEESDLSKPTPVEEEARVTEEPYPAPETPTGIELREERSVDVQEQAEEPEAATGGGDSLDEHQRELDQREAELEARARRLRDLERREREINAAEQEIARREAQAAAQPAPPRPGTDRREDVKTEEVAETSPKPAAEEETEEAEEIAQTRDPDDRDGRDDQADEPRSERATVPAGTVVAAEFLDTLSSESSRPGDTFRARINSDVRQGGRVVIPAGSEVVGEVTEAVPLRKVGGRAKLAVRFTDLVLPHGVSIPIDASFVGQGKSETGRDAATIGGAAAGGAVLGRVINKKDRSRGAVIGAILGAAIGTAIASRTDGEEVNIFEGSVLDLKLDAPLEVPARR